MQLVREPPFTGSRFLQPSVPYWLCSCLPLGEHDERLCIFLVVLGSWYYGIISETISVQVQTYPLFWGSDGFADGRVGNTHCKMNCPSHGREAERKKCWSPKPLHSDLQIFPLRSICQPADTGGHLTVKASGFLLIHFPPYSILVQSEPAKAMPHSEWNYKSQLLCHIPFLTCTVLSISTVLKYTTVSFIFAFLSSAIILSAPKNRNRGRFYSLM